MCGECVCAGVYLSIWVCLCYLLFTVQSESIRTVAHFFVVCLFTTVPLEFTWIKWELHQFYTSLSAYRSWGVLLQMRKELYICDFRGSCVKSDKLPFEQKFENEKKNKKKTPNNLGVRI